ncbi:tRNA-modifying protein YgfZ [Shewanella alkalitolerans]|uniref:tRNA-modifying protein YgfZ n=1 Tax=Shewanella alkalitolerans TaxID=2864209 RepID=UPI001C65FEAD|nr:tRNA-modifying protein YgfZ [Shewanella alkalitolerans]QYJ97075.1 tRNA-modifying protein YgfZ [Shewanella alkalitolerans]
MTLTVSQPQWPLNEAQPAIVFSQLSHLGLISVTGEQARTFIHGQVTTDITSLEADQWRWGAHCDPKGKMLASFRTFAHQDALLMMMPRETLALDLPQLQKYAVFSKAELVDASDDWCLLGVSGEQAPAWIAQSFGETAAELTEIPGGVILRDGERFILAVKRDTQAELLAKIDQPIYDFSAWQAVEIAAGLPNIYARHQSQFVPQMCNVQAVDGISFTKGCYMGQETVARMKYRGGNKRALYIVQGSASVAIDDDSQLEMKLEEDEGYRRAGTIVEAVQRDGQLLLSAVLPNDTPLTAQLRVAGDEASVLTLAPLPYSLDEE